MSGTAAKQALRPTALDDAGYWPEADSEDRAPVPIERLLREARRRLARAPFEPSTREASLLLAHVLDLNEARVLARSSQSIPASAADRFDALLDRRLRGEPVAYLLGRREFYAREFAVDPRVLIPRPETEHLIEEVLRLPLKPRPRILEIGVGSGCIAVTLAAELPGARVVATDLCPAALRVAAANARRHGVERRLRLLAADLAGPLALEHFDLVVSNPPYVDPADAAELSREIVDFEPRQAVFAPERGGSVLARLLAELSGLAPHTPLVVEIGAGQAGELSELAASSDFELRQVRDDYGGIPRIATLSRVAS